jgi:cupin fold WbuC family metalloprotein
MVLRGRILVVEFDDDGVIIDFTVLSAEANCWGAEIPANTWHTIISLESGSVAYEVKDGPYIPITDKNFALWAPKEGDEGVQQYLKDIIQQCT